MVYHVECHVTDHVWQVRALDDEHAVGLHCVLDVTRDFFDVVDVGEDVVGCHDISITFPGEDALDGLFSPIIVDGVHACLDGDRDDVACWLNAHGLRVEIAEQQSVVAADIDDQ